MNPTERAEALYNPTWDTMEHRRQLEIAMRNLKEIYAPTTRLTSPLDCLAPIYRAHGEACADLALLETLAGMTP